MLSNRVEVQYPVAEYGTQAQSAQFHGGGEQHSDEGVVIFKVYEN